MEKEAEILKQYGDNVFVKIPVVNTKGESTIPLIKIISGQCAFKCYCSLHY